MLPSTPYLAGVLAVFAWAMPAQALDVRENFLGMRFIQVPAGAFVMGTADAEEARFEIPEPQQRSLDRR